MNASSLSGAGRHESTHILTQIAAVVDKFPNVSSLDLPNGEITYAQLWDEAGRVATALGKYPGRVGLLMSRGHEACASYLGILRSGGTVVPLHPGAPLSRNLNIASSADIRAVIVGEKVNRSDLGAWDNHGTSILNFREVMNNAKPTSWKCIKEMDEYAYILFTSGSTGAPKGVPITHRNISAYLQHVVAHYELGPGCRTSHTFELIFDVSVFDLLATFASGSTLVVPAEREAMLTVDYIRNRGITHFFSVPSAISRAREMRTLNACAMPDLRWSLFIGEALSIDQAEAWAQSAPSSIIENIYGPTELTISCSRYRIPVERNIWPTTKNATVPIGALHPSLEYAVVDRNYRLGSEGELCVRGPQRLRSYLNVADNIGRFYTITDGCAKEVDSQGIVTAMDWYRTGDRVIHEEAGLVFLGRLDRQAKIRGYRVELGEVETALRAIDGLHSAAAITKEGKRGIELVAFYTGIISNSASVQTALKSKIPTYMMPTRIIHLSEIPLNANGKTDYRVLATMVD